MTRRSLYIVVTAFCSLLAVATSASAECAWVLWAEEHRFDYEHKSEEHEWFVMSAHRTDTVCQQELARSIERVRHPANPPKDASYHLSYKVTDNTAEWAFFPPNPKSTDKMLRLQQVTYICLPDTVDPREPKRK